MNCEPLKCLTNAIYPPAPMMSKAVLANQWFTNTVLADVSSTSFFHLSHI